MTKMPMPGRAATRPRCSSSLYAFEHRVRVDREARDHLLHGRELVAHFEEPESQRVADLLDDLLVGRDARARVEMEFDHFCDSSYLGT